MKAQRIVHKINYILGHKRSHTLKRIQNIQNMFSVQRIIIIESDRSVKTRSGKFPNIWKLNNIRLNNPWVKRKKSKEELQSILN